MASTAGGIRLSIRQRHALQRLVHEGVGGGAGLRATTILLSSEGQGAALIARTLGVGVRTLYECRHRWRRDGLVGMEGRHAARPSSTGHCHLRPASGRRSPEGPARAGLRLHLVDGSSPRRAPAPADRRRPQPGLGGGVAAHAWLRMEKGQAHHSAPGQQEGAKSGPAGACVAWRKPPSSPTRTSSCGTGTAPASICCRWCATCGAAAGNDSCCPRPART